jgi:hypothetical protein
MKYLSSTPSTLHIIQLLSIALIIVCPFVADVSWQYALLSIFMFYVYSVLGISMMLHRYYSHKSFKLNSVVKWFFTVFAVLAGRGRRGVEEDLPQPEHGAARSAVCTGRRSHHALRGVERVHRRARDARHA